MQIFTTFIRCYSWYYNKKKNEINNDNHPKPEIRNKQPDVKKLKSLK